jgi:tetratricopeptide (TPR) repeat protein
MLYFRKVPDEMLADPGEHLNQVIAFRKKIESKRICLFQHYDDVKQWRDLFEEHLCQWLDRYHAGQRFAIPPPPAPIAISPATMILFDKVAKPSHSLVDQAMKHANMGRITEAESLFAQAAEQSADPWALTLYGHFLDRIGLLDRAVEMHKRVGEIGEAMGDGGLQAVSLCNLGLIHQTRGDRKKAEESFREALELFKMVGMQPEVEKIGRWLKELEGKGEEEDRKGSK